MKSLAFSGRVAVLLVAVASCAPVSEEVTPRPADLAGFSTYLESALATHAWQSILASADPQLYRTRVVDDRIPEPIFIADLLGIRESVQEGEVLDWSDLERIEAVDLTPVVGAPGDGPISGTVTLEDGAVLRITAHTTRVQGRFVLTEEAP